MANTGTEAEAEGKRLFPELRAPFRSCRLNAIRVRLLLKGAANFMCAHSISFISTESRGVIKTNKDLI